MHRVDIVYKTKPKNVNHKSIIIIIIERTSYLEMK